MLWFAHAVGVCRGVSTWVSKEIAMGLRGRVLLCVFTACVAAAMADELRLSTGEVLRGAVVERTVDEVVFDHPVLGKLKIPADKVTSLKTAVPVTVPPPPPPPKVWASQIEAGFNGTRGNSTTTASHLAILAVRKTKLHALKLDAAHYYSSSNRRSTKNKFTAGLLKDWFLPDSPWLAFASARYDKDKFESWDHRLAGHAGMGHQVIQRPDLNAKLRFGVGAAKEWGSDDDSVRPEALAGGELEWQVNERQKFATGTTIYPDLSDAGEFRSLSYANWTVDIDRADGLSLKFGVEHEYQSVVDDDADNTDWRFFSALVFKY